MFKLNEEYFDNKYYFLLREKKDGGHLWFAVSNTLTEARKKDAYIKVPKEMIKKIQKHLDKLIKSKKGNTTKELNSDKYTKKSVLDISCSKAKDIMKMYHARIDEYVPIGQSKQAAGVDAAVNAL